MVNGWLLRQPSSALPTAVSTLLQDSPSRTLQALPWGAQGPVQGLRMCIFQIPQRPYYYSLGDTWHQARHAGGQSSGWRWEGAGMGRGGGLAGSGHPGMRGRSQARAPGAVVGWSSGRGPAQNLPSEGWRGVAETRLSTWLSHKGLGKGEGQWPRGRASWGGGL